VNLLQHTYRNHWYNQQTNLQRDTKQENVVYVCLPNKDHFEMSITTAIEMERISQME
jgi:predicted dehydrogenase